MNQTEELVNRGVSPVTGSWPGCRSGNRWYPRIWLVTFACLIAGGTALQAFPVSYTVSGTFGAAQGPDSFRLAGQAFNITGTIDSTAISSPSPCGGSCTYNNQNLNLTVGSPPLIVALTGVPITFAAGSPGSISIAATIIGVPFTAVVKLNLTSAVPRGFASQGIAVGSTVSYGAGVNLTTLSIASGTVSATSTAPAMNVAPASLSFSIQNGVSPAGQSLTVSAASPINFSAAAASSWLVVTPGSGSTSGGGTIVVSVDPTKLSTTNSGTFSSSITITSGDVNNSPVTVPVVLTVTGANTLTASPSALSFLYQAGGATPAPQSVAVGSTVSAIGFTAAASTTSGGNWLSASSSSASTPANLTVSVNPAGLAPNTYTGAVTLTAGGAGSPVSVQVILTVTAATSLTATPHSLTFNFLSGTQPPPAQTIAIATSGSSTSFTAATATISGGTWLSASPTSGTIPGSISVHANPVGLVPGTYNGSVTVTPSGGGSSALIVPVVFNVLPPGGLTASPASLGFGYQIGGGPPGALDLSVGSNGPPFSFTVSISVVSGGNWLSASASSGVTPAHITVLADPAGLSPNDYSAIITITPSGGASPLRVPVNLSVTTTPAVIVSATSLAFAAQVGGAAPGPRNVSVSSTGPVFNFQTAAVISVSQPWLTVGPGAASTPASVSVSVHPAGLTPGIYNGSVSISAPGTMNSFISIPVILAVTTGPSLVVAPASIAFAAQGGGGSPAPQFVDLAGTSASVAFTTSASTDTGGPWLAVSPAKGSTPGRIAVSANPAGLAPGSYSGSVSLSYGGAAKPLVIAVSLTVTPPAPVIQAITDAASLLSGPLAPLSLFTVWGSGLGPDQLTPLHLTSGLVDTTLANTQVLFNGAPAPLLMVQAGQINAIVPNSASGALAAKVQVIYQGIPSAEFDVQVAGTAPSLFTTDSSGKGQGAILNQDTARNSATNPAAKGSIVVLYANGTGQTNPLGADGAITPLILAQIPRLNLPVSVQFGGIDAQVLYAGPAPGQVAGLTQINARVPAGVNSGAVPVTVKIGGEASQPGAIVSVR